MGIVEYYEKVGATAVAQAVYVATGVRRTDIAVRAWIADIRAGRPLPEWLTPQIPAVLRALEVEAKRCGEVADVGR